MPWADLVTPRRGIGIAATEWSPEFHTNLIAAAVTGMTEVRGSRRYHFKLTRLW
ncbi:MAG: hypothetical protein ACYDC1_06540 [Limisphaerales bacterium]